jgi:hypothetical protein
MNWMLAHPCTTDVNHDILKTRISDKGMPVAAPGKRGKLQIAGPP